MGSLGKTVNMKSAFLILACLLVVITGDNLEEQCDYKALEIWLSVEDCKQCGTPLGKDCAKCIMEHKDYNDCKELQCKRNTTLQNRKTAWVCMQYCQTLFPVLEDNKIE